MLLARLPLRDIRRRRSERDDLGDDVLLPGPERRPSVLIAEGFFLLAGGADVVVFEAFDDPPPKAAMRSKSSCWLDCCCCCCVGCLLLSLVSPNPRASNGLESDAML